MNASTLLIEKNMTTIPANENEKDEKQTPSIPVPPEEEPPAPVREPPQTDDFPSPIDEDNPEKDRLRIVCNSRFLNG